MLIPEKLFKRLEGLDVNTDYAVTICSHIYRYSRKGNYVQIHKKIADVIGERDFKHTVKLLLDENIIERDFFVKGEKSFWYRISTEFRKNPKFISVNPTNFKISNLVSHSKKDNRNKLFNMENYLKAMDREIKNLSWDFNLMREVAESYVPSKEMFEKENKTKKNKLTFEEHTELTREAMLYSIAKIENNEFVFDRDKTSNRLHTNITNMSSSLYQTTKTQLVEIDVSNSQPFLLSVLIKILVNVSVYESMDMAGYCHSYIPPLYDGQNPPNLSLYHVVTLTKNTDSINFDVLNLILNSESLKAELKQFSELVTSGNFYEFFVDKFNISRDVAKVMMFEILFSKNTSFRHSKNTFINAFPMINQVVELIKEKEHNTLAIMLQSIESYLIIDVLCKRLFNEHFIIPITKHDSVAVPPEHAQITMDAIKGVFTEYCGIVPNLKIKNLKNQ